MKLFSALGFAALSLVSLSSAAAPAPSAAKESKPGAALPPGLYANVYTS